MSTLEIVTQAPSEVVDITKLVKAAVKSSNVVSGVVCVFCPHTTAGIVLQENTHEELAADLFLALANAVPRVAEKGGYRHAEGKSDAHVKAALVGSSQFIPIERGRLMLGTFQSIFLFEFDGPRSRQVLVKVLGD